MIDESTVRRIAYLARIGLEEKKIEKLSRDLGEIVEYVKMLERIDIAEAGAETHVGGPGFLRSDEDPADAHGEIALPKRRDDLLEEQAPGHSAGEIRVPKIL